MLSKDTAAPLNLLKGTKVSTPIAPFGGSDHWDLHESGVVFVTKSPDLPEAWHTRGEVFAVNFESPGELQKLTPDEEHGAVTSPRFSPDGARIAWLQMAEDGYESDRNVLQIYDVAAKKQRSILANWDRSPSSLSWSATGSKIYLLTEDYQRDKVYEVDPFASPLPSEPTLIKTPDLKTGSISHFESATEDGDMSVFVASSLRSVSEVYVHSRDRGSSYRLTTYSTQGSLSDVAWPSKEPEAFHYPAPDVEGEQRWGWIHTPPGYDDSSLKGKDAKWPVLILIHGGPEGAWVDSWSTRWNPEVFAAQGYLVATLNPTGSSGFGAKLTRGILGDWGGQAYRDILAGVHHVLHREAHKIDASRVAAAGASYGGYMINWLQGHNNDGLFKALVCHDGVFDTTASWYSGDELYFPESEFGGLPWSTGASQTSYDQWSPSNHIANWKTPQLIVHGAKDWRLTPDNGVSVFNALRRKGVPTRLVYMEKEGHWVLDARSSLRWHREVFGWVDKWIGKGANKAEAEQGEEQVQRGVQPDAGQFVLA